MDLSCDIEWFCHESNCMMQYCWCWISCWVLVFSFCIDAHLWEILMLSIRSWTGDVQVEVVDEMCDCSVWAKREILRNNKLSTRTSPCLLNFVSHCILLQYRESCSIEIKVFDSGASYPSSTKNNNNIIDPLSLNHFMWINGGHAVDDKTSQPEGSVPGCLYTPGWVFNFHFGIVWYRCAARRAANESLKSGQAWKIGA